LLLAGIKLLLLPFEKVSPVELLITVETCALALLIATAAWRASNRSQPYARVFWRCVVALTTFWAITFAFEIFDLVGGHLPDSPLRAGWPMLVINSFPVAIALTLPLVLREDRRLSVSWLQTLDIAQLACVVFAAFLAFYFIPSLRLDSDIERAHYINGMHLMRDGFLALGYLYRGWRSCFSDLRKLHFRMSGFLVAHGLSVVLASQMLIAWHRPPILAYLIMDLPPLALLVMAATWRQEGPVPQRKFPDMREGMVWTQVLPLALPASVVALAAKMTGERLRIAWILVTASFVLYAVRLLIMQRHQNKTLMSLAAMEERFSKAFKSSPAAITISRLSDGVLIDANDRWLSLVQRKREEAIGKTSVELGIFENVEARELLERTLRNQRFVRGMNLNFKVAGRSLETLLSAEVIELAGEPLIIASMLDVTELRSVTQQLEQAQKMELVGSLAGGVAHDFNNLLTIITGYSALALTRKLDAELAEDIQRIKEASGKAAALTRQLLAFSRRQVLQPRNISLNTAVGHVEKLLRRTIGENIALVTSLDPQLGTVHADPAQMEQVLMNLAINARDAMPEGGKLLFETKNLDLPSSYPEAEFEIPAGRYVLLGVTDTGSGILPEHMKRIFEPFFTTKGVGSGTGLGLSTVYGIIKQSEGYIWAYSDLGWGTTFKVCLPRVDLPPDAVQPDESETENLAGTETVLVVDDDARVCELTARILSQYGYQVMTADSGERAQRRAHEFGNEIHLLVTDLVMAGASGRELAKELKARRPSLKTLYMSGYTHMARAASTDVNFGETTLLKPFAPIDLARATKKTLNAR
jgi:PAS domain S-box-containing protein